MDTSKTSFTTEVQQYADTQDLCIEIPQYVLQNLNWEEGDELAWSIENNQIILTKVKDSGSDEEECREVDFDTIYDNHINPIYEATEADWKGFWYSPEENDAWS
jgi:antitoxin component of MazEF toxin-antitoxin module